jgi:hypothetical protein
MQANAQQQALAFVFFIFPNQHQIIRLLIYFAFSKSVLVSVFCYMNNLNKKRKKFKLAHEANSQLELLSELSF